MIVQLYAFWHEENHVTLLNETATYKMAYDSQDTYYVHGGVYVCVHVCV